MVGRVGHRQVALVGQPVGEEVVKDAAVLPQRQEYCAPPTCDLGDVVGEQPLEQLRGLRPLGLDLAHVRDVEDAAAPRAPRRCSARCPSYCTGISQPANGTSLAPASTWASYRGVLFSVSASTRATILPDMAIPEDELLRRLRAGYDAFNRGNYDATVQWIHPDVVYVSPGGISEVRGGGGPARLDGAGCVRRPRRAR